MKNPQATLQEWYPLSDFSMYFRYLESCIGTKSESGCTQDHHICPRKQFPELEHDPDNLITLRIEDHAHAHKLLAAAVPELRTFSDAWIESAAKGAFVSNKNQREKSGGKFTRAGLRKISEAITRRNLGHKHRETTRKRMQEAQRGKKCTEEHKAAMKAGWAVKRASGKQPLLPFPLIWKERYLGIS